MNITLIGMAGAGKTTIGKHLAKKLKMNFVDTDRLLEDKFGKKLSDILKENGSLEFIKLEDELISSLSFENTVIATGGSAIYGENAMRHLRKISTVVYLDVPLWKIKIRVKNFSSRGVVSKKGKNLDEIFFERLKLYKKYNHFSVDCRGKKISRITEEIIDNTKSV